MAERDGERTATFRGVLAVGEFRALWSAQILSVIGDQLARVAVTLVVYDRTRSSLLAAVAFAASVVPTSIGGIFLASLADRFPRRAVMIVCDLLRLVLVIGMIIPAVSITALVALLFAVTLLGPPFTSARTGIYTDVLAGDRYVLGNALTTTTYQLAQVIGFALGGAAVALLGSRPSLIADAATYGVSALVTWIWVHPRPATRPKADKSAQAPEERASRPGGILHGIRLAFGTRALRVPMLLGLLAAFYNIPEGVAAPLAHSLHGGQAAVGVILAAGALGAALGAILFTRLVSPDNRLRWMRPIAFTACAVLGLFALQPGLLLTLVVLLVSGLFDCYQVAASAAFVVAAPVQYRSQVFGVAVAEMSLGQGAALMLAGAAAEVFPPAMVIAAGGALGALVSLAIPAYQRSAAD